MTGNVKRCVAVINDLGALVEQLVDDLADHVFIARNCGCGYYDPVAGGNVYLPVLRKRHAIQSGHSLALRAGRNYYDLILGQLIDLSKINEHIFRRVKISQNGCDAKNVFHTAPGDRNLALIFCGNVDYLLQSVNIRRKCRYDNTLIAVFKQLIESFADLALGCGQTRLFHVCRVAKQCEYTLVSKLAEAWQIDNLALNRRKVYLKVACVHDRSDRRFYRKSNSVCNAVVNCNKLNAEAAKAEYIAGFFGEYLRIVQQIVLFELELNKRRSERSRVYGNVQVMNNVRHCADVILVPVGYNNAAHLFGVGFEIRNVGNNNINAVHILVRKAKSAVNNDYIRAKFNGCHILADLSKTAKGNDFQFFCHRLTSI